MATTSNSESVPLQPGLYIVATPIGNLKDITLRALEILKSVDVIAAEDTRQTKILLDAYGILVPMIPCHDHNESDVADKLKEMVRSGKRVALVSDAGTPLVSDPGYPLIQTMISEGCYITSIPGPSSVLNALVLSGMPATPFYFAGFLPTKQKERQDLLQSLTSLKATLVFFERASRLKKSLPDIQDTLGNRNVVVARELTKRFEQCWRGDVMSVIKIIETEQYAEKGEVTLVVSGADKHFGEADEDEWKAALSTLLASHSVKDAVQIICEQYAIKRSLVYQEALALKHEPR